MKVRVTEDGLFIPKKILYGVEIAEIKKKSAFIMVVPEVKNDPIFRLGTNPVSCNAPDASENPDKYIYNNDL